MSLGSLGIVTPGNEKDSTQPFKRRKVAESCKLCRAKKSRCDGQRPSCSPCIAKDLACEYDQRVSTVPATAGTLLDIEARLRKLEQQAAATQPLLLHPSNPITKDLDPPNPVIRIPDTESEGELPFTDHPTTQFIRDITQMADDQSATQQPQGSLSSKTDTAMPVETDKSSMVVPKRATADELLNCYEKYVYPLFPILHMPTFRASYERLWQPHRQGQSLYDNLAEEATFCATINIVFALGCLNNSSVEPLLKLRTADTFYRRARALLPLDALDIPTLEVVQCLLLTTNYLSFTKYSNRCYNTLAMAIRVAQTLRLHVDVESSSNNQLKREMNRRVWYHCLTLERLLCSLFGRKTMIQTNNSMPLPSNIDDEYLLTDGTGIQPVGIPSLLDAFIVTIKVFEVIEGAHKINYSSFTHSRRLSELTAILQLNEKIDQIEESLPKHLKHDQYLNQPLTQRDRLLKLQAIAIMTRILHLRLILLRPNILFAARQSLLSYIPSPIPSRTEITLCTELSTMCIQAAVSAISIYHTDLSSSSPVLGSSAVFVTLSAATVILAASLVPELDVSLDDGDNKYRDVIAKAMQVLDGHRWEIDGAEGGKKELERFNRTVNEARARKGGNVVNPNQALNIASSYLNEDISGQLLSSSGTEDTYSINELNFDFIDPFWNFEGLNFDYSSRM